MVTSNQAVFATVADQHVRRPTSDRASELRRQRSLDRRCTAAGGRPVVIGGPAMPPAAVRYAGRA